MRRCLLLAAVAALAHPLAAQGARSARGPVDSVRVSRPLHCGSPSTDVLTFLGDGQLLLQVRQEGPRQGLWAALVPGLALDSAVAHLTAQRAPDNGPLGWICSCHSPACEDRGIRVWRGQDVELLTQPESPEAARVIERWLDSLHAAAAWRRLLPLGAPSVPAN